jgi:hypothetical protein
MDNYEGRGQIFLNNRLLAEASKCTSRASANDNEVNTMHKGFAGWADGPGKVEVTVESAVPKKGYEADFIDIVRSKKTVTLTVISGGRRHTTTGRFQTAEWSNDVAASTVLTASFVGTMFKSRGG